MLTTNITQMTSKFVFYNLYIREVNLIPGFIKAHSPIKKNLLYTKITILHNPDKLKMQVTDTSVCRMET